MTAAPRHFVVVGTQRTGTSLIRTRLDSHPDVHCHGEVFKLGKNPYSRPGGYWDFRRRSIGRRVVSLLSPERSVADYLDELYGGTSATATGFKLMLSQCDRRPYLWHLLDHRGVSAIWVRRRNVLKTLVSRRAAASTGVYHVSESLQVGGSAKQKVRAQVDLPIASLVADLDAVAGETDRWLERLRRGIRYMEIDYESYVTDRAAGDRAMLGFLGVRALELSSDLEKVNPEQLEDVVRNYAEVQGRLRGTRYEGFLDE